MSATDSLWAFLTRSFSSNRSPKKAAQFACATERLEIASRGGFHLADTRGMSDCGARTKRGCGLKNQPYGDRWKFAPQVARELGYTASMMGCQPLQLGHSRDHAKANAPLQKELIVNMIFASPRCLSGRACHMRKRPGRRGFTPGICGGRYTPSRNECLNG
jgi:hypothetical protein